jgi:hypothetical protein
MYHVYCHDMVRPLKCISVKRRLLVLLSAVQLFPLAQCANTGRVRNRWELWEKKIKFEIIVEGEVQGV